MKATSAPVVLCSFRIVCLAAAFLLGSILPSTRSLASADDSPPPKKPGAVKPVAKTDLYDDPLPEGALARMGTVRFRHHAFIRDLAVSRDGKLAATSGEYFFDGASQKGVVRIWELATGKETRTI